MFGKEEELQLEIERLRSCLEGIKNIGFNERCIFCGFKDRIVNDALDPKNRPLAGDNK